jgi:hypothetical protein
MKHSISIILILMLAFVIPCGFANAGIVSDSAGALPPEESAVEAGDSLEILKFRDDLLLSPAHVELGLFVTVLFHSHNEAAVRPACPVLGQRFCRPPPSSAC